MARKKKEVRVALIGSGFMGKAHSNAWSQVGHFFKPAAKAVKADGITNRCAGSGCWTALQRCQRHVPFGALDHHAAAVADGDIAVAFGEGLNHPGGQRG